MMKLGKYFNKHALLLFFISFSLGSLFHYVISDNNLLAKEESPRVKTLSDIFMEDFINNNNKFPSYFKSFKSRQYNDINIAFREDADFKYLDIVAGEVYKDALKIDIGDGLVKIESDVKNTQSEEKENGRFLSTQSFYINRSFSIPDEVDEKKVEIIKRDNVVVVKFPKIKDYI